MKRINLEGLEDVNKTKPRTLLKMVIEQAPPGQAFNISEMRRRCNIVDAVERKDDEGNDLAFLDLEDQDYDLLRQTWLNYPWVQANKGLLAIADRLEHPVPITAAVKKNGAESHAEA